MQPQTLVDEREWKGLWSLGLTWDEGGELDVQAGAGEAPVGVLRGHFEWMGTEGRWLLKFSPVLRFGGALGFCSVTSEVVIGTSQAEQPRKE